mmetsp:Transcript_3486/g.3226  ORF Transcript_3486/g.3226 Transcript_3486/m.3226 type:complete len:294 (-) Transcript_3486:19-900(-)|eukprot:CAMPEP_0196996752 /NCGR_PEP_ID=MMETSP1380-20130617/2549_1 /TAXON_ID=5936 /ORGANISM="Euplotes crassus, Strain CT5" /LENGTH=293 /DNA_ID=CAMNT_0042412809 /DNA_START=1 /DNA_END=882 /DNA_ORIENTATION=-
MESSDYKEEESFKMFEGYFKTFTMQSEAIGGKMKFGIYFPPSFVKDHEEDPSKKFKALWYLHGLTCFESLFFQKCPLGLKKAADLGLMMIFPDTSPRDAGIEGETDHWSFGVGAGYYVDATQEPWAKNYNMYSHVTKELRDLVEKHFNVDPAKQSICGHSVGGHGSLVIFQKNLDRYVSCSAFAPMTNSINSGWGKNAFEKLFGEDNLDQWKEYDACELAAVNKGKNLDILVDQGDKDCFYPDYLLTENFKKAGEENGHNFTINMREGYDHGFPFINTFIESHLEYHDKKLSQ